MLSSVLLPHPLGPISATTSPSATEKLTPNDSLLDAVRRLGVRGVAALPVVDATTDRVLGLLSRHHVFAAYERSLAAEQPPESNRELETAAPAE